MTWRRPWHGGITNEWVASQTPVSLAGGAATLSVIGQVDITPHTQDCAHRPAPGCGRTQHLELLSVPLRWHAAETGHAVSALLVPWLGTLLPWCPSTSELQIQIPEGMGTEPPSSTLQGSLLSLDMAMNR